MNEKALTKYLQARAKQLHNECNEFVTLLDGLKKD